MKTITTFCLFIILFHGVNAQDFSFQLRFRDALGTTNSVTMGYDATATNGIDAGFQETDILANAWFSPLEARIGDKVYLNGFLANENTFLSKKQIVQKNCAFNSNNYYNSVQFAADNYPLTIKWDKSLFINDSCKAFASFVGRNGFMLDVSPGPILLRDYDSIVIKPVGTDLTNLKIYTVNSNGSLVERFAIETYPKDGATVALINFTFKKSSLLSTNDLPSNTALSLYPNPVASGESIHLEIEGSYEIIDGTGRIIQNGLIENHQIPTKSITSGNYTLRVDTGKSTLHQSILIE